MHYAVKVILWAQNYGHCQRFCLRVRRGRYLIALTPISLTPSSINAVKGVELGAGFKSVAQKGTEHRDEMTPQGFLSNNAGGVLGGISTGQDIVAHIALKPTSSITIPGRTIDLNGNAVEVVTKDVMILVSAFVALHC